MKKHHLLERLAATLALIAGPSAAAAESGASSPAVTSASGDVKFGQEITMLSPFTVDTTRDRGYQGENTLSGTRLNSSLRDIPASVSIMTPEFLQDVGLDGLGELVGYSVNSQVYEYDTEAVSSNDVANAAHLVKPIDTRGIRASQALDYFKSITPDDTYRIQRYDDSRGPNSILFGISDAGGLINQTSKVADTVRDRGSIKFSTGSNVRQRIEFDLNKVLRNKTIAASVAAVHQENGGWRLYDFQDKQRVFGSVIIKPNDKLSISAMGETGREVQANLAASTPGDNALAWYDNRQARGVSAVTFAPLNAMPTAAQQALGVTGRLSNANGVNRSLTFIANDGLLFDAVGSYLTGSYNNPAVRAPDGTPGRSGTLLKINDPRVVPYEVNAGGPGMFREFRLRNYTVTADWQLAKNLFVNFGHNFQRTNARAYFIPAANGPLLRGDPNTTMGVRGAPNPHAGQLYFDAGWKRDTHQSERKENRLSLSYELNTAHLGSHRVAAMVSRAQERDLRVNAWLTVLGAPFGGIPSGANNRITTRSYVNEADPATFTGGDWRDVPPTVRVDGRAYDVGFTNDAPGVNNTSGEQTVTTRLAVVQSHFFERRLVTTLGYREDAATVASFGYATDPIVGDVTDFDPAKSSMNKSRGQTRTFGAVFHVGRGVSLVANASSNIGLPDFTAKILPVGGIPDPSRGRGRDYGVSFDVWGRKLTAKAVYFETSDKGDWHIARFGPLVSNPNLRIMDAFESVLVGPGRPIATADWSARRAELTPLVNGTLADAESRGYEFSAIANPTENWRIMINYSYTDRSTANLYVKDTVPWYGFKTDGNLIRNGVTQDASGRFILDPGAFESVGTIAKWISLSSLHPQAALSTLTTANNVTIAEEVFDMIDGMNEQKRLEEQRWGLRPHRVSVFTSYDIKKSFLKGVTVGGGYRWRSANVIGSNLDGREIRGVAIREADFMLRYAWRVKPALWKGNVIFQLNVINAFNEKGIIPKYLAATPPFLVPGGRGIGYSRFDLTTPRAFRFTTTYEF